MYVHRLSQLLPFVTVLLCSPDTRGEGSPWSEPKKVGPFLIWAEDAYSKYEHNEFHYSRHLVGDSALHGCCSTHVHVLWERRQDEFHSIDVRYPLAVAVPNFLCNPESVIETAVQHVRENPESFDKIQNRMTSTAKDRRGGGYPGPQIGASNTVSTRMLRCIKPVMAEYFPYIDQVMGVNDRVLSLFPGTLYNVSVAALAVSWTSGPESSSTHSRL